MSQISVRHEKISVPVGKACANDTPRMQLMQAKFQAIAASVSSFNVENRGSTLDLILVYREILSIRCAEADIDEINR